MKFSNNFHRTIVHSLQYNEPSVEELFHTSCVADCYRIVLALLLKDIKQCQDLCPGHLSGLIPYLFHSPNQRSLNDFL